MLEELWTFSVRSLNGAWVLYRLNLLKWLLFDHYLEVKRNQFLDSIRHRLFHTSQDHFCSLIDEFPVWNSEPDQTMMMRWATFPEREKVLRLLSWDSKHWWSLATPLWAANKSVAVWVVRNLQCVHAWGTLNFLCQVSKWSMSFVFFSTSHTHET